MGCETPEALSSITMVEDGAAMKILKSKNPLHSRRKTEKAIKDYKLTYHALLLRRTENKEALPISGAQLLWNFTRNKNSLLLMEFL